MNKRIWTYSLGQHDRWIIGSVTLLIVLSAMLDLSPIQILLRLTTWTLIPAIMTALLLFALAILTNLCGRLLR
jgi:hypothetical protein